MFLVAQFEKAQHRQNLTLKIADNLSFAAIGQEDAEAEAIADMLYEDAKDENLWVAEDLDFIDGKTGKRKFIDAYGSLNVVPSRSNPAYLKLKSARGRKRLEAAIRRVKPQSGEKLRFITLTLPDLFGFDFASGYEVLTGAMVRFKNTPYFKKNFRGGGSSDEFTLGENLTHFHFHEHLLAYTKWLDFGELRRVWTLCLQKAALGMGRELKLATKDGLAVADVREVRSRAANSSCEISLKDAIRETCKYTVKGSDFANIPTQFVVQVETSLRGRRLVETFGEANLRKGRTKMEAVEQRQNVHKNDTIQDFSDFENVELKPETLRKKGARLIREGRRDEWKAELTRVYAERRQFRRNKLAQRYQYAIFCTLSGEVWRGVKVSDERYYEYLAAVRGDFAFA
jgi:hypothetical protein